MTSIVSVSSLIEMDTSPSVKIKHPGETVEFHCAFKARSFDIFTNPLVWRKAQGYPDDSAEVVDINLNKIPQPPFDTERFIIPAPSEEQTDCHAYTLTIRGKRRLTVTYTRLPSEVRAD